MNGNFERFGGFCIGFSMVLILFLEKTILYPLKCFCSTTSLMVLGPRVGNESLKICDLRLGLRDAALLNYSSIL